MSMLGWRSGLAISTAATALVTTVNVVFLVVAFPRLDRPEGGSEGAIYDGSCKTAKKLSLWLHLAINVLGTVLLGASNYTQQVLTAPTREEIDVAHRRRQWMDIGVMSLHNLRKISGARVIGWTLLALSSLPIHMLYNSSISFETGANDYRVYGAKWEYLNDPDYIFDIDRLQSLKKSIDNMERLDNRECISAYGMKLISDRSDVILVLDLKISGNDTFADRGDPMNDPYDWICDGYGYSSGTCDLSGIISQPDTWAVHVDVDTQRTKVQIQYCLSQKTEEHCRLILSIPILSIVIGCNVFKLVGLLITWLCLEKRPLLTLGDAIASFLDHPDPTTKGMCLLSKASGSRLSWQAGPQPWTPNKRFWASSISWRRYVFTFILCFITIGAASFLLKLGIDHIYMYESASLSDLWDRGFGQVNVDSLIDFFVPSTIGQVLLSNLPQLIVSLLYAALNGMWTAMLVGDEWNSYGLKRKGLRTTHPTGHQRSTYWLSLPLRYGIPLIIGSATLHWLISQSIFFVRIVVYGEESWNQAYGDGDGDDGLITCGYSCMAIIFSIALGSLILLTTVGGSLRRMKTAIPGVGTCSAVVSAACHRPEVDELASRGTVKWGVVSGASNEWGQRKHCCVTTWGVTAPEAKEWYQ